MSRTLLIDGDIPVYMAAASNEFAVKWSDEWWTYLANEKLAINDFDSFIGDIAEALKADRVIIALSGGTNFRKDVYPGYKANRAATRPPLCRYVVQEHAIANYETMMRPGLEGDDVLGILATRRANRKEDGQRIIVSIDKDMRTIPGFVLNWNHAHHAVNTGVLGSIEAAIYEVSKEQADYFHLLQTLAGDTADGYPGCPGIGMQTADDILHDMPHIVVPEEGRNGKVRWVKEYGEFTPWETIVSYYAKKGLTEEDALVQARVARICRASDYDFKRKEVRLWTP